MNDVPRWQAKFIAEFYYETYHYLYPDVPHFSQLNNEESFMLAALIYGDLLERWPIMKDAQNYVRNGNKLRCSDSEFLINIFFELVFNSDYEKWTFKKGLFLFYERGKSMGRYGRW